MNPVLTFSLLDEYRITPSGNDMIITHTSCGFARLIDNNLAGIVREAREHHATYHAVPDPWAYGTPGHHTF